MTERKLRTFEHLLCLVDGSEASCRAIEVAACLAQDLGAKLGYVAIARAAEMTPELKEYFRVEKVEMRPIPLLKSDAEACLQTAARIADGCGAKGARYLVRIGDPAEEIGRLVLSEKADLVVVGHHPRSMADRVVHKPLEHQLAEAGNVKLMLVP